MKPGGGWSNSRRSEGQLPMAEDGPATSGRKRSGASYAHEWNRFCRLVGGGGETFSARDPGGRGGLP